MFSQQVPIHFYHTTCCAMLIASIKEYHTYDEIKASLDEIKANSDSRNWHPNDRSGGERNVLCITSPGEDGLEKKLIKLGFKCLNKSMARRYGYPPGLLKMFLLTWNR